MAFKVELSNNSVIKNSFESISKIVDEITLTADSEGMHLRALDRSNTILKKCKNDDILKLSVDESSILIIFDGDARRKFKLPFIDMEYDNPTPPNIDLPCKITIPSTLLKNYIDDMGFFSDKLDFIIDENYFKVKTSGQKGDAETEYLHGENILEVVKSGYSIPKLQEIMKAHKFSEQCNIYLGNDMPLKINFTLVTGDGNLEYLLAPRLEETD